MLPEKWNVLSNQVKECVTLNTFKAAVLEGLTKPVLR